MGGFPPVQGQEPMPQNNGFNGYGGGNVSPMPAPNQPQNMMPAPNMAAPVAAPVAMPANNSAKNTLVETIILVVVCIIAAVAIVLAVLYYMKWNDLSINYTAEKDRAVAEAQREQREADDAILKQKMMEDTVQYAGPDDLGRISFNYPKIWSVYEAENGLNNSDYAAYFGPAPVLSINDDTARYALRFEIVYQSFENIANAYSYRVQDGSLKATSFSADSGKIVGTRYEGMVGDDIEGILVIAKIDDKTLALQTDFMEYADVFNKILSTLRRK